MPVNSAIVYETGYTRDKAIKESNPDRKDGVLLINHHIKKPEFYATDWNTFCLTVDRRKFTKSGEPINYVHKENVEQSHLEVQENNYSFDVEKQNLFPDEVEQFVNDLGVNKSFREGTTSQILVNAYERNPQARKKCIEHYGTSCFVCGFNFGKVFGQLGEGFIHVHHLKPISEIGQEYEINPIEDMRPVCPNCHAMIHRQTPLLSIEEVQSLLQKSGFYQAD
jgi:predicted HNH restriction endonuclease